MTSSRLAIFILFISIVIAIALRVAGTSAKTILATDESPSYLNAAGQGCKYYDLVLAERQPISAWVPASAWKKFLRIEQPFCFGEIAHSLSRFDIHPPLYFWLLHLWALIFGIHGWTGPSLNIVISVFSILCLYGLARRVLRNPVEAAVVTFTWALSPAVFHVSFEARHYDLLALVAILFVRQIVRLTDPATEPQRRDHIFLMLVTAAGALTHYYFSIFVAGGGLYALAKLIGQQRKRLLRGIAAVLCGYAVFFLLHPSFYNSFRNEQKEVGVFSNDDFIARLENLLNTFKQFFPMPVSLRYILLGAIVIWLLFVFRTRRLFPFSREIDFTGVHILYFFAWPAAVQIALYLAYLSPQHAALPKHFSLAWPFLAFIPVFILRLFKKLQIHFTIFFWLLVIVAAVRGLQYFNDFVASQPNPTATLQRASALILDNASMNVLPRIVTKLPDDTPVFVASRDAMQKHPAAWLDHLDSNAVYISVNAPIFNNNATGQDAIVALIQQNCETEFIKKGAWSFGDIVLIKRKLPVALLRVPQQ